MTKLSNKILKTLVSAHFPFFQAKKLKTNEPILSILLDRRMEGKKEGKMEGQIDNWMDPNL